MREQVAMWLQGPPEMMVRGAPVFLRLLPVQSLLTKSQSRVSRGLNRAGVQASRMVHSCSLRLAHRHEHKDGGSYNASFRAGTYAAPGL
jgi:hypothetical protein